MMPFVLVNSYMNLWLCRQIPVNGYIAIAVRWPLPPSTAMEFLGVGSFRKKKV